LEQINLNAIHKARYFMHREPLGRLTGDANLMEPANNTVYPAADPDFAIWARSQLLADVER